MAETLHLIEDKTFRFSKYIRVESEMTFWISSSSHYVIFNCNYSVPAELFLFLFVNLRSTRWRRHGLLSVAKTYKRWSRNLNGKNSNARNAVQPISDYPALDFAFLYLFHICFLVEAAGTRSPSIRLEYHTPSLRRLVLPETEHSFLPPPVSLALDRGLHEWLCLANKRKSWDYSTKTGKTYMTIWLL